MGPGFVLPARRRSCRPGFESACVSRWVGTDLEVLPVDRSPSFVWNERLARSLGKVAWIGPVRRGGSAGGRSSHRRAGRRSTILPSWIRVCSRLSLGRNERGGLSGMGRAGSALWQGPGVQVVGSAWIDAARSASTLPAPGVRRAWVRSCRPGRGWAACGVSPGRPSGRSGGVGLFSRRVSPQAGR